MQAKSLMNQKKKTYFDRLAEYEKAKAMLPKYISNEEYEQKLRELADKYEI